MCALRQTKFRFPEVVVVVYYESLKRTVYYESLFVYYESIKREPKIRGIYECRCDERLQTKTKRFTRLPYTGLVLELEHLKIERRLFIMNR
jgi:hypothetical protein